MFSGLIPGLNSAITLEDELSSQIPAIWMSLLDLTNRLPSIEAYAGTNSNLFSQSVAFFRRQLSEFGVPLEFRTLVPCLYFGLFVTIAVIALSQYSEEDEEEDCEEKKHGDDYLGVVAGGSPEAEAEVSGSMDLFRVGEIFRESNARPNLKGEPSWIFCGICFEEKQIPQMFTTESCSHSFCYDCMSKHIAAKIQDNIIVIPCPGIDCKTVLDPESCRQIVPKVVLVRWDECLCKSLIPESQRVCCPYGDCSATLVNDSGETIGKADCPSCKRLICARCGVPWHSEFTCAEFKRLSGREEEDVLVEELAKKKRWRKCPNCNFYVEKTEGCLHVTCRCGHEFCYRCGAKWDRSHGICRVGLGSEAPRGPPRPSFTPDLDYFFTQSGWDPPPPPLPPLPLPPPSTMGVWDYFSAHLDGLGDDDDDDMLMQ
ncbi:uncharacterized protein LOC130775822 [Actinidia eriantha]|uniref:uncharacterized protein LOC130775822 n=1 Tax=Actinidia eriantha TaxID=165200 RepID=UPI002590DBCF|nr:uncharacterized protein LOC130775822 [Actinidia eriantha]